MDAPTPLPELHVLRDPSGAALLMDPQRRGLVEELRRRPDSAAGLARRLGEKRQRLNYHLRALEEAGVLEPVPHEGLRRGREKVFRVSARHFVVDPATLGSLSAGLEPSGDSLSVSHVVALASRVIQEVVSLQERAHAESARLATGSLDATVSLATPEEFRSFLSELSRTVAGVVARYHQPGPDSRTFRVVTAVHQKDEDAANSLAQPDPGT